MITPKDDLRHLPTAERDYSESKWFSFYDQTHDFWVSSRIGLEPNKKQANRWLVIAIGGKIIYHDLALDLEIPSQDWDRLSVGGLWYQTLETMAKYRVEISLGGMALDLVWEASTPVFDYKDCVVPLPPSLAAAHYEQSGTAQGNFHLPGRTYRIEGTGHRDHSWGVRRWEGFRSWVAFMGHFGQDFYFHVEQFDEQTTGVTRHGFISQGGENVPLKEGKIDLEFSGQHKFPRRFRIQLEDSKGNVFPIDGEVSLTCPLQFGKCVVGESFGTFSSEGETKPGIIEYGFTG